jgi:hypothetical protein
MRRTRYAKAYTNGAKTGMNGTEGAYKLALAVQKAKGEIEHYEYEPLTLKLADGVRYTPDFMVIRDGIIELHEVKAGRIDKSGNVKAITEDASRIKLRIAAESYPFRFVLAVLSKKGWQIEEVGL